MVTWFADKHPFEIINSIRGQQIWEQLRTATEISAVITCSETANRRECFSSGFSGFEVKNSSVNVSAVLRNLAPRPMREWTFFKIHYNL